jgi:nicotinamide-nucleotide amidase
VDVVRILAALQRSGQSVAAAESLTGGLLTAALTSVPGSSAVVRGGIVAYGTDLKALLLGVDGSLLADAGPVDSRVAAAMACGVRERLGATFGVATTGEAGPESSSGAPVGTVHIAVCGPRGAMARQLHLAGGREPIREAAVAASIGLLGEAIGVA